MLKLLKDLGVYVLSVLHYQLVEMEADSVDDLTLVDYRVKRVPHLVRDCGIDQTQELPLGF